MLLSGRNPKKVIAPKTFSEFAKICPSATSLFSSYIQTLLNDSSVGLYQVTDLIHKKLPKMMDEKVGASPVFYYAKGIESSEYFSFSSLSLLAPSRILPFDPHSIYAAWLDTSSSSILLDMFSIEEFAQIDAASFACQL